MILAHAHVIRHTTRKPELPGNLTLLPLPPACPELNAAENIWQYLRQTYPSNRVFASYTAILDSCQNAWRRLPRRGRPHRVHCDARLGNSRSMIMKASIMSLMVDSRLGPDSPLLITPSVTR
jgi:hypothetical protein